MILIWLKIIIQCIYGFSIIPFKIPYKVPEKIKWVFLYLILHQNDLPKTKKMNHRLEVIRVGTTNICTDDYPWRCCYRSNSEVLVAVMFLAI